MKRIQSFLAGLLMAGLVIGVMLTIGLEATRGI